MYKKCWLPVDKTDLKKPFGMKEYHYPAAIFSFCGLKVAVIWDRLDNEPHTVYL